MAGVSQQSYEATTNNFGNLPRLIPGLSPGANTVPTQEVPTCPRFAQYYFHYSTQLVLAHHFYSENTKRRLRKMSFSKAAAFQI